MWPWRVKMPTQNLLRFVTDANVDDEDRVGNSLMHTWELKLGNKANFVQTLTTRFGQDFEVEQKFNFMTKPQLPNLQRTVANTILIIKMSNSNNLNKFLVGIFTHQGHINQVY